MESTVTVSPRAVMQIAAYIAKNCKGVHSLVNKSGQDSFQKMFKGRSDTKGVYLKNTKKGITLEICVICEYGVNTNVLCNEVTDKIKEQLINTGFKINRISVNIMDVKQGT